MNWKTVGIVLVCGVVLALVFAFNLNRPAVGAADTVGMPRHTVVQTDGAHLIVTDNQEDKIYFYAIDKDGKVGDELKLRGSADLKDVGKPTIKPHTAK